MCGIDNAVQTVPFHIDENHADYGHIGENHADYGHEQHDCTQTEQDVGGEDIGAPDSAAGRFVSMART